MITIIGNGESRKDIDIDKIPQGKVGCNGIYLYNKVDLICAMDKFWRDKKKGLIIGGQLKNVFRNWILISIIFVLQLGNDKTFNYQFCLQFLQGKK